LILVPILFTTHRSLYHYAHHQHLHPFPTRRSSDLPKQPQTAGRESEAQSEESAIMTGRVQVDLQRAFQEIAEFNRTLERSLEVEDRKSTRLNSSHVKISYAVFCLKKKKKNINTTKN